MEAYIDNILNEMHSRELLKDLDEETLKQLKSQMLQKALDLINRRMVDSLSEKDVLELEQVIDANPQDQVAIENFISQHVPSKDQIVSNALVEFKTLYIQSAS